MAGWDVSLLAFDEPVWANIVMPPLAVVRHPTQEVAAAAWTRLLARMQSPDERPKRVIYGRTLELVLQSNEVDAVAVMLTTIGGTQAHLIATEVVKQVVGKPIPVVVCWTMPSKLAREGIAVFAQQSIPVFDDPVRAIRAASLSSSPT